MFRLPKRSQAQGRSAGIGEKQCNDTLKAVVQAVLGTEFRVTPVTDVKTIMTYGVAVTPAVVVDGKVM